MNDDLYRKEREEIEKHLALLENQRLENHKLWDTQILGLSTLILGLSLTVLNEIISFDESEWNFLLYISWFLLWATIVSTIVNFYVAEESQVRWKSILIKQAKHSQRVHYFSQNLNTKLKEMELSGNMDEFKKSREIGIAEIQGEIDRHEEALGPMNKNHEAWVGTIRQLNTAKTVCFLVALTFSVIYIVKNI